MSDIHEPYETAYERGVEEVETEHLANSALDVNLLPEHSKRELRGAWQSIQADFVDDPRDAVARADELVDRCMRQLSEAFTRERGNLEGSWSRGEDVSTEDLRMTLQRYRAFFQRFLSM